MELPREREALGTLEGQLDEKLQYIASREEAQQKLISKFNERLSHCDEEAQEALDQRHTDVRAQEHEEWRRKAARQEERFEETEMSTHRAADYEAKTLDEQVALMTVRSVNLADTVKSL